MQRIVLCCARIQEKHRPDIVGVVETGVDESVQSLHIPFCNLVSRRDRETLQVSGLNHGGIALYAKCGGVLVTQSKNSTAAERSKQTRTPNERIELRIH